MKQTARLFWGVAGAALLVAAASSKVSAGDAVAGQALAKQWCVTCHDIGHSPTVKDGAPSFVSVARRPDITPDVLKTWLADPHPPMPKLSLSRQEIDDLVTYIGSLK